MATRQQLEKWRRALRARFPIVGRIRRRSAVQALARGRNDPHVVPLLVEALGSGDEVVAAGAALALRDLGKPQAIDALCNEAICNPGGPAARICVQGGMRHSDHERNCLYLFVTRQLDAYFKEDFEFQALRLEYERADAAVRGHVMEIVRSGDRRCLGFIRTGGGGKLGAKPLAECTDDEIVKVMESWMRHQEWDRLFQACLEMPLKHGLPALRALGESGWEPEAPDLKSVFRQVLADSKGVSAPTPRGPKEASSLFERWLEAGRGGELAGASEADLLKRLEAAEPPAAVPLVAALAAKARPGSAAAKKVQESPHWLTRLAGHATGLAMDLARDTVEDANLWIKELAIASGVLEFWPGRATPADLEALSAAPAEAWAGRLGAARKVLRTIMAYRVTVPEELVPIVVGPDEFAPGEVEPVIEGDAGTQERRS